MRQIRFAFTWNRWAFMRAPADVCAMLGWLWAVQIGPISITKKKLPR